MTQEEQFGLLDQTYVGLVDARFCFWCGCMWENHRKYALQIIHGCTRDHTNVRYVMAYPMINT
jgi:hypothetical protein